MELRTHRVPRRSWVVGPLGGDGDVFPGVAFVDGSDPESGVEGPAVHPMTEAATASSNTLNRIWGNYASGPRGRDSPDPHPDRHGSSSGRGVPRRGGADVLPELLGEVRLVVEPDP